MRRHFAIGSALLALASLAVAGCSGESSSADSNNVSASCTPAHPGLTTIEKGVLTVAQYPYPPFSMYADGKLTGVEGDVLTKIAEMECLKISIVPGLSAAMITNVQTGRADTTLGSWYRTKARQEVVNLSAPIVTSPLALVSKNGADTVDAMLKMKIGTGTGMVALQDLQKLFGDELKAYPDTDAQMTDLKAGRIEGVVIGLGAAVGALHDHPIEGAKIMPIQPDPRIGSTASPGQTNFPTNKSNKALGEAIDDDIEKIRSSGGLKKIAEKYDYPVEATEPGTPNLL
ncbi:transporter substrate-binding domain-containing protein [Microbispora sp. NPDC046933]|uniref:substrate-binding periplasmic protein n=1 Tax=Microbispora sp. NPDC046933 TaxID=3155618 RepID=UPI00340942D6